MSLREIANHAKVSTATVSRVINGVSTVNRNLAKRVRKAIGEHGYSGNTQARCLVSGKSRLFGLVISDMRDPFFPEIVQSFEAAAIEVGCETLVTSTLHDPKRMELSVRRMVERRIEGAAVLTFGSELNPARDEIYQPQEYLLNTDLVLRRSTALACLKRSGLTELHSLVGNSHTGETFAKRPALAGSGADNPIMKGRAKRRHNCSGRNAHAVAAQSSGRSGRQNRDG